MVSLLDRLIDENPPHTREPVQCRQLSYSQLSYSQLRATVGRDLENLLNTKCFTAHASASFPHLDRSLYVYGLSDFTSKNPRSPTVRSELRQEIERAIQLFEPRLSGGSVQLDQSDCRDRRLRFKIRALLVMDQGKEPVSFDTYFDINRGEYQVPDE